MSEDSRVYAMFSLRKLASPTTTLIPFLYCRLHVQLYVLFGNDILLLQADCLLSFASVEFDQSFILKSNIANFLREVVHLGHQFKYICSL